MRLNPDCIRDILLFVEENTDFENTDVDASVLVESLIEYDENTLFYHIIKMNSAKLFDKVEYCENELIYISSLSWTGHAYLDNIRDNNIWAKTKSAVGKLSSISLPILIQKAADIATMSLSNS
ncbi:DUF2513 domain-containing protein [Clostridium perfringens]|nr:DUF2513 domain-containing protein [Clostridium perfringens]